MKFSALLLVSSAICVYIEGKPNALSNRAKKRILQELDEIVNIMAEEPAMEQQWQGSQRNRGKWSECFQTQSCFKAKNIQFASFLQYCRGQQNSKGIMKLDSDCGPTTEPQDMIGVPTGPAGLGEEAETTKNPDFQTQLS